jgi:hypothetical protein
MNIKEKIILLLLFYTFSLDIKIIELLSRLYYECKNDI